ncbi:MAG: ABC transporter ATP-binding protein [Peptostreptococcaceae bacterium]|nr:ABC transporter ATP-binding protein [Peptostreptococcaceae bacterium]
MLCVENVTKCFGTFTALEDISIRFSPGIYGLLAPNGAGKTTLMKMLATLLFPTRGQILWEGEEILSLGEDYRGVLGYLPQSFGCYPGSTARGFLSYAAALQKIPKSQVSDRVDELLALVGLSEQAEKKLRQFSGGMLQRVGIATAMIHDPKLLILDEPTAGLDPKERVRFRNLIHSLSKDRIVILSTHIVSDIETVAGQIVMIADHTLRCCDTPSAICRSFSGRIYQQPSSLPLPAGARLLSEVHGEEGAQLRFFCERPLEKELLVTPSLEDAFLATYLEEEKR